ncbi:DUF6470 family protein [Brevibacillus porteri]|uniref:Uncharacterized protein n=1 Tax=Brevibacillus porteri TaxID=2126350 RepID=A0ABX5FP51_9BACL|nr:DUF6470 family protein [Brevibacillus porteri]MED1801445.1 DUF6470 family protein [Brevibacillus porteri]MED2133852.1 DUF6470 family protein [Brevibacillus porteri]MED2748258.1 DUF6470 family protein [Brevibacillus porteri]MED2815396.1 DUF6470 family protein [Brevibacillus porteri]MED2894797.1 DUF6470 family protein [Brevibacillus porteri]
MHIPQLRMESKFAQLGLNIRKPVQEIKQPQAEMNLSQKPAELNIEQARTDLQIDSSQARANIGIMTSMEFSDSNASYGKEKWLQAIAEKSQEGDRMMRIYTKENAIAEIGREKGLRALEGGFRPPPASSDEGVEVSIQAKPVIINIKRNGMSMNPVLSPPELSYTQGKVEPYMLQYNSLKISVIGSQMDQMM